jgi:hypothetical protein
MEESEFLNIDLEIESKSNITCIINELGSRVIILRNQEINGLYFVSLETIFSEGNEIINEYLSLINGLKPKTRELWDNCTKREFNFGYRCSGKTSYSFQSNISEKSIHSLSKIGGSVAITIYSPEK